MIVMLDGHSDMTNKYKDITRKAAMALQVGHMHKHAPHHAITCGGACILLMLCRVAGLCLLDA